MVSIQGFALVARDYIDGKYSAQAGTGCSAEVILAEVFAAALEAESKEHIQDTEARREVESEDRLDIAAGAQNVEDSVGSREKAPVGTLSEAQTQAAQDTVVDNLSKSAAVDGSP